MDSGELVTEFTMSAEKQTEALCGVPINTGITGMQHNLRCNTWAENNRQILYNVNQINNRVVQLLNGLICFKESILCEVSEGRLFTFNYPLLIEHIMLDPSEEELIKTAHEFAMDYKKLLEMSMEDADIVSRGMTEKSLAETLKYREFKNAGTKGILNCDIASVILPLLADHVLREANHYIRILQYSGSQKI